MDSSDDSDGQGNDFEYWSDWRPPDNERPARVTDATDKVLFNSKDLSKEESVSSMTNTEKFGNWIPPLHFCWEKDPVKFRRILHKKKLLTVEKRNSIDKNKVDSDQSQIVDKSINDSPNASNNVTNVFNVKRYLDKTGFDLLSESKYIDKSLADVLDESTQKNDMSCVDDHAEWEKILNQDWGKKIELHDLTNFNVGDTMWGIVRPGIFGSIKLWENEYGNICGFAEGKISKEGTSEMSNIIITDPQNLRKLLNLTYCQWSSLVDMIQKNKVKLKFEALTDQNLQSMSSIEKLWYYTCKRRHFLPDQCMFVKFSGAIKSMQDFKIIPKLIVEKIRDLNGKEIS